MSEAPPEQETVEEARARRAARTEAKNQAVRDSLEPLAPGERPGAVTIAAVLAVLMAIANVGAIAIVDRPPGADKGGELVQTFLISGILLISAIGMWRAKYWAVLGFQTILALQSIILFLLLTRATSVLAGLLLLAIVAAYSVLFWYLIRAMARLQMPESPDMKKLRDQRESADQAAREEGSEKTDG